jgi:GMP synthase (glutamine-hydrolysing)
MSIQRPESTIHFVDPGIESPELDILNYWAARSPLRLSYHQPGIAGFNSIEQISASREPIAGIVVMGSAASVNDTYPWINQLSDWLKPLMLSGIPTLGLCFGHQLIGKIFGSQVEYLNSDRAELKGLRNIRLNRLGCFENCAESGPLVIAHGQVVRTVPQDFELLATSSEIAIDGLAHRHLPIWSFQPHPEATRGFLVNQGVDPDPIIPDLKYGHSLVNAFLHFCAKRNPHR